MIRKNVFAYILAMVLLSAVLIQVARSGQFEQKFAVNQGEAQIALEIVSSKAPRNGGRKIIAVCSKYDEGSKALHDNIYNTFKMGRLDFEIVDVESEELIHKMEKVKDEDIIVIGTERFADPKHSKAWEVAKNKVAGGSSAVFMGRMLQPGLDELCGIRENRGYMDGSIFGIEFHRKFFPGLDSIRMGSKNKKMPHSSMDVSLMPDAEVVATAQKVPVLWTRDFRLGRVVYFNSTMLMDKANRGMLMQGVAMSKEEFLYSVLNAKIVNIDDFPAPIKPGRDEVIYSDYSMNNRSFYRNIWWSSMYNMARRYNVKYTGLVIGTYNLETKAPLPGFNPDSSEDLKYFGRKLAESGGEIGVHGYNHNSLALEGQMDFEDYGYYPWESEETMDEGLEKLKEHMESMYGRDIRIYTYVPPSNIISKEGKESVKRVFPDIKVFAGLYTGSEEQGVLYQEFGKDPDIEGAYDFPRISSGYEYSDGLMWDVYSGIAHCGIFNHFIHPDDLLDKERSKGRDWEKLERGIESILKDVHSNFPRLRGMTNKQALDEYVRNEDMRCHVQYDEDSVIIRHENVSPPAYYILRLEGKTIKEIEGGGFSVIDKDRGIYMIEAESADVELKFQRRE